MNTQQNCGTKVTEAEGDSEFFPRESSDSGLLEEIVHRFLPKTSKPEQCESAQPKTEALSLCLSTPQSQLLPPQPVSGDHGAILASTSALCYDSTITKKGVTKNEDFGVCSDHRGFFPMQQFDSFNSGNNTAQAIPLRNGHHLMMSDAEYSIFGDIFQYPELLNEFAARMQNA